MGAAAAASGAAVIGALGAKPKDKNAAPNTKSDNIASPAIHRGLKQFRLATTWPKDFPGLGQMPNRFAKALYDMSGGMIDVKVYAAGELVGALECLLDRSWRRASALG